MGVHVPIQLVAWPGGIASLMLASYYVRVELGPGTNKREGIFHSDTCFLQNLCSRRSSQEFLEPQFASLGDSRRIAGRSGPGSCQPFFLLCILVHVMFCVYFINEVSISLIVIVLPKLSLAGFQNQMLWELIFPVQESLATEPNLELRTLIAVGDPLQYNYSPVCGGFPGGASGKEPACQ